MRVPHRPAEIGDRPIARGAVSVHSSPWIAAHVTGPARLLRSYPLAFALVFLFTLSSTTPLLAQTAWAAWWPATGLVVGVTALLPRRAHGVMAGGMALVTAAAILTAGLGAVVAVVSAAVVWVQAFVGARLLRTRADRALEVDRLAHVIRLLLIATVVDLTAGVGTFIVTAGRGADDALAVSITVALSHAIGFSLIVPILLTRRSPESRRTAPASLTEASFIWATLLVMVVVVFVLADGVPLAFLVVGPLTWGAARLRQVVLMRMVVVTVAIAHLFTSLEDSASPSLAWPPLEDLIVLQLFDLTVGVVFLALTVIVSQQRLLAAAVEESEELYHSTFDSLLSGMAIVTAGASGVAVTELNPAARSILVAPEGERVDLAAHLDASSMTTVRDVVGSRAAPTPSVWRGILTLTTGRRIDALLSRLTSTSAEDRYSLQFLDVTEQLRAKESTEVDLARAASVQRALLPKGLAPLLGYDVAGVCIPAKEVGGDFYDWYAVDGGLAFSLGDVMGKGVGAGMIAATVRSSLRSARLDPDPTDAVRGTAEILETEVGEMESFATLFHARLRAADGALSFVDAGHGLTLLLRADGSWQRLSGIDPPLGSLPGHKWESHADHLQPGDMLVSISDGILDLYDGTLATLDEVAEVAREAGGARAVVEALAGVARQSSIPDDVTVLAVKREPLPG